ncbi:hypothetical protein TVAG_332490 [Trichomonas vaginalis G3]|uniref:Uncharacterized protein n=1 Tax=Trichomonas vaginalis (strain ATCC PRA-98 / G3) TaxID=412133 RepID=A2FAC2_TRIV3|nr:hypothetical protein TVAGG3_0916720 [Trichomonas vaginalis G3]EAX98139.1 hypothetical protein TVAG_332490 [Trichomonas vaginalis G3]KAI5484855.1 hypothetical protein TVAGG3_0916720 [Trichomonas vaginalis G3]|eukprot:XP_001311069.1 hypothetical protein [Trichomonas vaginalis G3]
MPPRRPATTMDGRGSFNISIPAGAKTLQFKTARFNEDKKYKYISSAPDDFGNHSPHWTIGCPRSDPPVPPETPGPGQYNIPVVGITRNCSSAIGHRSETNYATITSGVDYRSNRVFPEIRRSTIGASTNVHFYDRDETPAPTYVPPGLTPQKITIGQKYQERSLDYNVGPADYTPVAIDLPNLPAYSFPRAQLVKRGLNDNRPCPGLDSTSETPGPGSYNVVPELRRPKKWTEKLRVHPKRYTREHEPYDRPWARQ